MDKKIMANILYTDKRNQMRQCMKRGIPGLNISQCDHNNETFFETESVHGLFSYLYPHHLDVQWRKFRGENAINPE